MLIILSVIFGIILLWIIIIYNSLVSLRNQVKNSFSGIDVQLKRRNDLIPNLVNTVQGYVKHEREVLAEVTRLRISVMQSSQNSEIDKLARDSENLSSALRTLFAVSENYPDLKASNNFLELQNQLARTEDQIAASRRIYNSNVMAFNSKIQVFPNNLIARRLNFTEQNFFEIDPLEKENVKV